MRQMGWSPGVAGYSLKALIPTGCAVFECWGVEKFVFAARDTFALKFTRCKVLFI